MFNTMKRGPPYTKADSQQLKHYLDARFFVYLKLTGNLTKLIKNLLETYNFFLKVIENLYETYVEHHQGRTSLHKSRLTATEGFFGCLVLYIS